MRELDASISPAWSETYAVLADSKEETVRGTWAQRLALIFEDPQAIQQLKNWLAILPQTKPLGNGPSRPGSSRIAGFDEQLIELTADQHVQMEANGLAEYDHPADREDRTASLLVCQRDY
ncbi:MAG: hypothetical protein U0936_05785 [Planctomycetaceae bacterium]